MEAGLKYSFNSLIFQFFNFLHAFPLHFIAKVKVIKVSVEERTFHHYILLCFRVQK